MRRYSLEQLCLHRIRPYPLAQISRVSRSLEDKACQQRTAQSTGRYAIDASYRSKQWLSTRSTCCSSRLRATVRSSTSLDKSRSRLAMESKHLETVPTRKTSGLRKNSRVELKVTQYHPGSDTQLSRLKTVWTIQAGRLWRTWGHRFHHYLKQAISQFQACRWTNYEVSLNSHRFSPIQLDLGRTSFLSSSSLSSKKTRLLILRSNLVLCKTSCSFSARVKTTSSLKQRSHFYLAALFQTCLQRLKWRNTVWRRK